jgi:hypothetical protein
MEAEIMELADRHPLVSLVSACFWVIRQSCDLSSPCDVMAELHFQCGFYHGYDP